MFDVFYRGPKPGLFPFELPADTLAEAASLSRTQFFWFLDGQNDYTGFDFNYRSVPWEQHQIHTWANQWQQDGGTYFANKYTVQDNVYNYHTDTYAHRLPNLDYWHIPDNIDPTSIDQRWAPDPLDPPYVYQFPVKWGWERIGGPEYRVPGATAVKFVDDFFARTLSDMTLWQVPANIDKESFDFTWVPHPAEEPYIYKFPTVWNEVGGPEYHTPGATQEKYIDVLVARTLPDRTLWTIPEEVNADTVDFSWVPHPQDPPYIYHFGTEFQSSIGLTYTAPGATEVKFAGSIPVIGQHDNPVLQVLDIFFIDRSNVSSAARYEKLVEQYPQVQRVRYVNSMIDTIRRCIARAKTSKFWVVSSENVYDNFNFSWHAQPWQSYMTHVFGSQHQKWSDTYLINRWEFERVATWANSLEEFPNLNFVQDQCIIIPDDLHDIYFVDHGNDTDQFVQLQKKYANIKSTRYVNNYLDTFKRIMSTASTEYVWIISSLCDYTRFDFSWQPEPWQKEMIHVFPSANQARGDTFYIHVESFKLQMVELDLLDWFNVINYCKEQRVPRLPIPYVTYEGDNLIEVIKQHEFKHPYTWFVPHFRDIQYNPSVWSEKDKKLMSFSSRNSSVLAPREVKNYINTQAYDYPYIDKMPMILDTPLDIVYISNGEPDAEQWYNHLKDCVDGSRRIVHRIDGVNGRVAAYKAAAEVSKTPWFFAVFAKLEVNTAFDWDWQPDYLQGPKHYIFHSKNPVNGLEYGHMGVIAYNRRLTLATEEHGLDFTLSAAHAVVPLLSATAHYNTTPELTWRTAFRECIKLKDDVVRTASIESKHRLNTWLSVAEGSHSEWSLFGAQDAVEYYDQVEGNMEQLMLTFEWAWLKDYWAKKYTV